MHDIKLIREYPESFTKAMRLRGVIDIEALTILALDEEIRQTQHQLQELQAKRNEIAKKIGQLKASKMDASALLEKAEEIKNQIPELERKLQDAQEKLHTLLANLPNIPNEDVPFGQSEEDNIEIRKHGTPRSFDFMPKEHFNLGEDLRLMDFEQTAKISGARFTTMIGLLARLERALAAFMLDIHTKEFGYIEISPPALVKENAMFGTGQLPKLAQDSFKTTNDYYLIPTSEVFLTNLVAEKIIAEEELPLRYTAFTPCFRSEAGSAGKDTRGMIRQHQFSKVELVSIVTEKDSRIEHERMLNAAEEILKRLELPYRVVVLCTGDLGFSSKKTYDLEVWLPGQHKYREISSCSECGDFQARRMKARYKKYSDKKNYFVHTLNGSGLAVGRTVIAIMENYQNADGSITIPTAMQPYMNNLKIIERR